MLEPEQKLGQMSSPGRQRASLYLFLIFLCGALTGAVAVNVWTNWWPRTVSARADSQPYSPQHTVEKFTRELSLTPTQAKELNDILDETHKAYGEHESQIEVVRQQGRNRIREILTSEQRPKYEAILARMEQRRRLHR